MRDFHYCSPNIYAGFNADSAHCRRLEVVRIWNRALIIHDHFIYYPYPVRHAHGVDVVHLIDHVLDRLNSTDPVEKLRVLSVCPEQESKPRLLPWISDISNNIPTLSNAPYPIRLVNIKQ